MRDIDFDALDQLDPFDDDAHDRFFEDGAGLIDHDREDAA